MRYKILTSDDSKMVRVIVGRTFGKFNCEVLEASCGSEAIEAIKTQKPDLVLLDITMPDMTGLDVLRTIRGIPETKDTQVIMLTAESGNKTVEEADSLGVKGYIAKPFKDVQLIAQVEKVLELEPA